MTRSGLLKNLARFSLALLLGAWILHAVPLDEALSKLASASVPLLLLSLLGNLAAMAIQAFRWRILLGSERSPTTSRLFLWNLVGGAASFVLPSSASGDVVKSLLMGKEEGLVGRSLVSTAIGRYLGLMATLILCMVGFFLWPAVREVVSTTRMLLVAAALVGGALVGVAVLRGVHDRRKDLPEGGKWDRRFRSGLAILVEALSKPRLVAAALGLSLLLQVTNLLAGWCLFLAVGSTVGLGPVFALLPLVQLGTLAPVSLGGVGVREGLTLALFHGLAGIDKQLCLAANLAGYLVTALLALAGLVAWLVLRRRGVSTPQAPSP